MSVQSSVPVAGDSKSIAARVRERRRVQPSPVSYAVFCGFAADPDIQNLLPMIPQGVADFAGDLQNSIRDDIMSEVLANRLCAPPANARWRFDCSKSVSAVINTDTLRDEFSRAHILLVAKQGALVVGFAMMRLVHKTSRRGTVTTLQLQYLCSSSAVRGMGTVLLSKVDAIAHFVKANAAELHALDYMIGSEAECKSKSKHARSLQRYYENHGFIEGGRAMLDGIPMLKQYNRKRILKV